MSDPLRAAQAIRSGVALYRPRPAIVRVRGSSAYDVVERICPRDLFVRTGQLLHSLVLDEHGGVAADLYVAPEDDDYLLIADGLDEDALARALAEPAIERLGESTVLISLAGPYACELLTRVAGPQVATFGYLTRFALPELAPGVVCLRAGTTGEYGYELLIPRELAADVDARIRELGRSFDLVEVEQRDIDHAALESGFFCPRHRGVLGRSPVELQLQWRLSPDRRGLSWRRGCRARARQTTRAAAELGDRSIRRSSAAAGPDRAQRRRGRRADRGLRPVRCSVASSGSR